MSKPIYNKTVTVNNPEGMMKMQFFIALSDYDTSEMAGFKEGDTVYTGHTVQLSTLKPSKKYPRARIDIDPSNPEIRKAIEDMYHAYDALKDK